MPILAAEPQIFPNSLFDEFLTEPEGSMGRGWWVLHTKPRQEKSLARQLHEWDMPFFLPLIHRRSLVRGRPVTSYIPLFTSYLFLLGDDKDRVRALTTHRVVCSLKVVEQEKIWDDLKQIHQLIQSGAPITPEDRLEPGVPVEIRSGPLEGLHGKIIRTASGRRFVVEVNFIQRGASVELDDFMLSRVKE